MQSSYFTFAEYCSVDAAVWNKCFSFAIQKLSVLKKNRICNKSRKKASNPKYVNPVDQRRFWFYLLCVVIYILLNSVLVKLLINTGNSKSFINYKIAKQFRLCMTPATGDEDIATFISFISYSQVSTQ